jgi:RNA polymerase sigma factor (sigma-70 family)
MPRANTIEIENRIVPRSSRTGGASLVAALLAERTAVLRSTAASTTGIDMAPNDDTSGSSGMDSAQAQRDDSLEMLRRASDGDDNALEELFSRLIPQLRRWSTGRLPRWARERYDTEDLVQETVLQAVRNLEAFEPRQQGGFLAYLRNAVLNRIRNEMRNTIRKRTADGSGEMDVNPAPSPLDQAISLEAMARYESALQRLTATERDGIRMRIEEGRNYREIAKALGWASADAARMAVGRALRRVAEQLSQR